VNGAVFAFSLALPLHIKVVRHSVRSLRDAQRGTIATPGAWLSVKELSRKPLSCHVCNDTATVVSGLTMEVLLLETALPSANHSLEYAHHSHAYARHDIVYSIRLSDHRIYLIAAVCVLRTFLASFVRPLAHCCPRTLPPSSGVLLLDHSAWRLDAVRALSSLTAL
jgi:hypothetical protein